MKSNKAIYRFETRKGYQVLKVTSSLQIQNNICQKLKRSMNSSYELQLKLNFIVYFPISNIVWLQDGLWSFTQDLTKPQI